MRRAIGSATTSVKSNRLLLASGLFVVLAVGLWALLDWQLAPSDFAERRELFQLLAQILGGVILLVGVYLAWRRITAIERTVQVAQEGQITERFTRAIEQLAGDKLEVRLGGIYALERIARDSEQDHWPIMEVLTAYVRENARWKEDEPPKEDPKPAADIQAILTVIGRRERAFGDGEHQRLDLRGVALRGANLIGAHLEEAMLSEGHLERAILDGTHLEGAILFEAHLEKAILIGAYLEGAILADAHLERANLRGATGLTWEQLWSAASYKGAWLPD